MHRGVEDFLPLAHTAFCWRWLVKTCTARIMREVSRQSEGRSQLGPGTLYGNLQRLIGLMTLAVVGFELGETILEE